MKLVTLEIKTKLNENVESDENPGDSGHAVAGMATLPLSSPGENQIII